jgi:hypothetical protein
LSFASTHADFSAHFAVRAQQLYSFLKGDFIQTFQDNSLGYADCPIV